jgi:hypothetical protein
VNGASFFKPQDTTTPEWVSRQMASCVDRAPLDHNTLVIVDDNDPAGMAVLGWKPDEAADQDRLNAFLADRGVLSLGLAIRLLWSPTPHGKSEDAWFLTTVSKASATSMFAVRHVAEGNDGWHQIANDEAPFLALSTASSLRAVLATGEPLVVKEVAPGPDRSPLFNKVSDIEWPQEQADGRL